MLGKFFFTREINIPQKNMYIDIGCMYKLCNTINVVCSEKN